MGMTNKIVLKVVVAELEVALLHLLHLVAREVERQHLAPRARRAVGHVYWADATNSVLLCQLADRAFDSGGRPPKRDGEGGQQKRASGGPLASFHTSCDTPLGRPIHRAFKPHLKI